ncbi:MAG: efflux RND transporter periplasmic adaptor subunit [Thermoanaerobaculia bacterium]|nr:efflux RND transporter periplasmic adaptor subunit [Thermoanaerobaculia bacterium]
MRTFRSDFRSGPAPALALALALALAACGGDDGASQAGPPGANGGGPGGPSWGGGEQVAAVPVEVAEVERRQISTFIETNGTLEAENEVDIVARVAAPIASLETEEGRRVRAGQVLARLEEEELRADLEIARVALEEARLAYERARKLEESQLISPEAYEQALTRFETAKARFEGAEIQLGYTVVRAPFSGLIVARYVDRAQQVAVNTPLFRLSDFDPLLAPIQVPERELPKLAIGQRAYLTVEAYPGRRFSARVLRISPVVDAATGTVKVTLEVDAEDTLRPGMFARVFVETATRPEALVIPKAALSLESIGDTVYVAADGKAHRREVELGYREGDFVEAVSGVAAGERVVVVGQDGLSDGTPVRILAGPGSEQAGSGATQAGPSGTPEAPGGPPGGFGAGGFDPSNVTPEQLEAIKERMRARGMSEKEIEERLKRFRERGRGGS